MGNRLYTAAVVVFWMASMTWLVTDRILPPFFGGEAPRSFPTRELDPVAWRIEMDGEACGTAVMQSAPTADGVNEVHSLLRLDGVRAPEGTPFWLSPTIKSLRSMKLTMRSVMTYDSLSGLSSFHTGIDINRIETPIRVNGRVEGGNLTLVARVGGINKKFTHPWPEDAAMSAELTPAARLLPLYEGRRWTQEVFSPLASPNAPLELIEAEVTERLRVTHAGEAIDVWRVRYLTTERTGSTAEGRLRAELLVASDGRVLRQDVRFLGSSVSFVRLIPKESLACAEGLLELDTRATTTGAFTADHFGSEASAGGAP